MNEPLKDDEAARAAALAGELRVVIGRLTRLFRAIQTNLAAEEQEQLARTVHLLKRLVKP